MLVVNCCESYLCFSWYSIGYHVKNVPLLIVFILSGQMTYKLKVDDWLICQNMEEMEIVSDLICAAGWRVVQYTSLIFRCVRKIVKRDY
jgi:hypothetical protein